MERLIAAVEDFLKRLEHLGSPEPTASLTAHVPVPELIELRAAHAEATAPPAEAAAPESPAAQTDDAPTPPTPVEHEAQEPPAPPAT